MLGNGRPFVLEIFDPKRSESIGEAELKQMEKDINLNPDV